MTAAADAPATTTRGFALVPVSRRDLRRLRQYGPPPVLDLPARHGGEGDPRYPSLDRFTYRFGVAIDVVLHLMWAGFVLGTFPEDLAGYDFVPFVAAAVGYAALSFVHRVLVQRVWHTTLGKALAGIRLIRDDTGGPPTLGSLARGWLTAFFRVLYSVFDGVLAPGLP